MFDYNSIANYEVGLSNRFIVKMIGGGSKIPDSAFNIAGGGKFIPCTKVSIDDLTIASLEIETALGSSISLPKSSDPITLCQLTIVDDYLGSFRQAYSKWVDSGSYAVNKRLPILENHYKIISVEFLKPDLTIYDKRVLFVVPGGELNVVKDTAGEADEYEVNLMVVGVG